MTRIIARFVSALSWQTVGRPERVRSVGMPPPLYGNTGRHKITQKECQRRKWFDAANGQLRTMSDWALQKLNPQFSVPFRETAGVSESGYWELECGPSPLQPRYLHETYKSVSTWFCLFRRSLQSEKSFRLHYSFFTSKRFFCCRNKSSEVCLY